MFAKDSVHYGFPSQLVSCSAPLDKPATRGDIHELFFDVADFPVEIFVGGTVLFHVVFVKVSKLGYALFEMNEAHFRHLVAVLAIFNGPVAGLDRGAVHLDHDIEFFAHVEGNSVRAAYNYAEYLPERRKMMQWWADYLDQLRAG